MLLFHFRAKIKLENTFEVFVGDVIPIWKADSKSIANMNSEK